MGRLFAALLLAGYAPIGVLGYGLHRVLHAEHVVSQRTAPHACHCHCGHDHAEPDSGDADYVACTTCCDDCSICAFLAQAQSASVIAVAPERVLPLAAAPHRSDRLEVLLRLESAYARGPPALS
jgi:hypothetical protein